VLVTKGYTRRENHPFSGGIIGIVLTYPF